MLDWTDRYFRMLARKISHHVLLYTEMVTTAAILHGDQKRHLEYFAEEHPLALQLGGSEPAELAHCAMIGAQWGYDEINLNVGCPSDRVQSGAFGACLMAEPRLVADCVKAMQDAVSLPVTVKHRIGIDDHDSYDELCEFVGTVAEAGCRTFIVHARKAWLKGLSPKENRDVPPLDYQTVYRLKRDFAQLEICINGGILSLTDALEHLKRVDGVMIGRAAYHDPWMLAEADRTIFGEQHAPESPHQVVEDMLPFIEQELSLGTPLHAISRHMLGMFHGAKGARRWRRMLSEEANKPGAGIELIRRAMP